MCETGTTIWTPTFGLGFLLGVECGNTGDQEELVLVWLETKKRIAYSFFSHFPGGI